MDKSKILFVDWRDILCGRLEWRTGEGARLGVANPPEPYEAIKQDGLALLDGAGATCVFTTAQGSAGKRVRKRLGVHYTW